MHNLITKIVFKGEISIFFYNFFDIILSFQKEIVILQCLNKDSRHIALWCNGSTQVSGTFSEGSSPSKATIIKANYLKIR